MLAVLTESSVLLPNKNAPSIGRFCEDEVNDYSVAALPRITVH